MTSKRKVRFKSAGVSVPSWLATDRTIDNRLCETLVHLCMVCCPRDYGEATTAALAAQLRRKAETVAELLEQVETLGYFRRIRLSPIPLWVMNAEAMQSGKPVPDWHPDQQLVDVVNQHSRIRNAFRRNSGMFTRTKKLSPLYLELTTKYGSFASSNLAIRQAALQPLGNRCRYPKFANGTFIRLPRRLFGKTLVRKIHARDISGPRHLMLRLLAWAKGYQKQEYTIKNLAAEFDVNRDTMSGWLTVLETSGAITAEYILGKKEELNYAGASDPATGKLRHTPKLALGDSRVRGVAITITQNKRKNAGVGAITSKLAAHHTYAEARRDANELRRLAEKNANSNQP